MNKQLNEQNIAQRICEIQKEINQYDAADYNFNVIVTSEGNVHRGDLHINSNSWTQWEDKADIIAEFTVKPMFTTSAITEAGDNPEDEKTRKVWNETADYGAKIFGEEMANAIVNGEAIEEIYPEMNF